MAEPKWRAWTAPGGNAVSCQMAHDTLHRYAAGLQILGAGTYGHHRHLVGAADQWQRIVERPHGLS